MNTRDLIMNLIAGGVLLFGLALIGTLPHAFRSEHAKDPHGGASGFAVVVDARPHWSWFARALVVIALTLPARGAR
ncbi:hypothetical protein Cme02nite_38650 [Catellatospora methionotrophica]|uniref:Uncharacterized protein n=1 Tax=Catellatospora methionotrophica TaxID=121620 RepID=A0A8J3L6X4_9ACTN|nr:hypothetical protein [Catellatospora methionotrophica]GIG15533.1 hypothetical protein Cme02nite_38650 [Catellatospora methionotrophica]